MDTVMMKERNYRMVEMLRHQNEREQRRLEASIYSSGGLEANHRYTLENMSREQQIIKQELGRLRQTSTTTWGVLPPRPGEEMTPQPVSPDQRRGRHGAKRKKKSLEEKKLAEQRKQAEALRKFREEVDRERWGDEEKPAESADDSAKTTDGEKYQVSVESKDDGKSVEEVKSVEPSSVLPHLPPLPETSTSPQAAEDDGASSRATNRSTSVSDIALVDINVHEAKDSVNRRLVTNAPDKTEQPAMTSPLRHPPALSPVRETEAEDEPPQQLPQPSAQLKKTQKKAQPKQPTPKPKSKTGEQGVFDQLRYNPDGSLRTVHTLPDFQSSLREAMKARYLRMKGAQWIERELSTSEIFSKRTKTGKSSKSGKSTK